MPFKRPCRSDDEIIAALTKAVEKHGTMAVDVIVLLVATVTGMILTQTTLSAQLFQRLTAQNAYSRATTALNALRDNTRLYLSHFIQSFNMGVARGLFPESDRLFYGLDIHSGSVPDISSDDKMILWGNRILTGDPARVLNGGAAMDMPTKVQFAAYFDPFLLAHTAQLAAKEDYETAQQAVAASRAPAMELITKIWGEVEAYYSNLDPSAKRTKCKEWGVLYVNSATDNSLEGKVTDTNNNPVAGAVINVEQLSLSTNSNSNGEYSFASMSAGNYTLKVTKTGFQEKTIPNLTIESGATTTIEVQLISTTGSLHAIITSSAQPLAGATIAIESLALTVSTAQDGTANMNGVSPGTYVVTISKPNFVVQTLTGITINAGGTTNIGADLVSTTGTLIANVYSQGLPLGGATVRIDAIPVQVITGNDGIGRLEALPPNTYYVSAQAPGKVTVTNSIAISANQTASLTFDLPQIG